MTGKKAHQSLVTRYDQFKEEIQAENRYFLSRKTKAFLSEIGKIATDKNFILEPGKILYRARINEIVDNTHPALPREPHEMMPKPNLRSEGRANSFNLMTMYLADNVATAVAEVRPDVSSPVTVSKFSVLRSLKLVDFIRDRYGWSDYYQLYPNEGRSVWLRINSDFAKVVPSSDLRFNYLPTQFLAEFFKSKGFDGLVYQSQYKAKVNGLIEYSDQIPMNFALFDINAVKHVEAGVWRIVENQISVEKLPTAVKTE